ncbi:multicopper oxidase family protein, partial [uncultured Pseudonocardia sp.]|uniref:multicopper oxidase family protein n=1 Tax=uncultured Pseudonocardia sp. TaxID=211455 RepID=UPI00261AFB1D
VCYDPLSPATIGGGSRLSRRRAREVQATGAIRKPGARTLVARAAGAVVAVGAVVLLVTNALAASAFPETFSMMRGAVDDGGGTPVGMAGMDGMAGMAGPAAGPTVSVADLTGPTGGVPDCTFDLVARQQQIRLASGTVVDAWTFNGQAPGPELRMRQGELVEVRVRNELPADPVTVHWHGMDVPNAEDGVSGITQDAIGPGQDYVYRFRVNESGARWYHSHQAASVQVIKGLFGPIVIDPATPGPADRVDTDADVQLHDWDTAAGPVTAMGTSDVLEHRAAAPGSRQRLRLANTANYPKIVSLTGVPFRVTALDGGAVNQPTDLTSDRILLAAGGRVDVGFTMPATPVRLVDVAAPTAGIAFSADGKSDIPPVLDGPMFDPTTYGTPEPTPFGPDSHFDREFDMVFDEWLNFYDDRFGLLQTANGQVYPDTPMHMVREGDLVKFRFVNRASEDHPMHLHGHHVLELSRDGRPTTGSPIWLDTVNVGPGETVEVGFRADNPGLWMDHCHNLVHTDLGLILHLAYENVSTPYMVGGAAHNVPE